MPPRRTLSAISRRPDKFEKLVPVLLTLLVSMCILAGAIFFFFPSNGDATTFNDDQDAVLQDFQMEQQEGRRFLKQPRISMKKETIHHQYFNINHVLKLVTKTQRNPQQQDHDSRQLAALLTTPSSTPSLSNQPSTAPSQAPSSNPTFSASPSVSDSPSTIPTRSDSPTVTLIPSQAPSSTPSTSPSSSPTISSQPSTVPTGSYKPSVSASPSTLPTLSNSPTLSSMPSQRPSGSSLEEPSSTPSMSPSSMPTATSQPSLVPSATPTTSNRPSLLPTTSSKPSRAPTDAPTESPTNSPIKTIRDYLLALVQGDNTLTFLDAAHDRAQLQPFFYKPTKPMTMFAPTDAAFVAFRSEYPELYGNILTTPWLLHLQELLMFHLTEGARLGATLLDGQKIEMENGEQTTVELGSIMLSPAVGDFAIVTQQDVIALDGVMHIIDSVLTPTFLSRTVIDVATTETSIFYSLIVRANLESLVNTDGVTLFAPTDAAIRALGSETLNNLRSSNGLFARQFVRSHIVMGVYSTRSFRTGRTFLRTAAGRTLRVIKWFGNLRVQTANIVKSDLLARNGIVHTVNRALLSPSGNVFSRPPQSQSSFFGGIFGSRPRSSTSSSRNIFSSPYFRRSDSNRPSTTQRRRFFGFF